MVGVFLRPHEKLHKWMIRLDAVDFTPPIRADPNTRIDEPLTVENGPEDQPEKPDFSRSFNPVKLFEREPVVGVKKFDLKNLPWRDGKAEVAFPARLGLHNQAEPGGRARSRPSPDGQDQKDHQRDQTGPIC